MFCLILIKWTVLHGCFFLYVTAYNYKMGIFKLFLYFSIFSILREHADATDTDVQYNLRKPQPQLGSLVTLKGDLEFITGVYIVNVNIRAETYIEEQAANTYDKMLDILHILEHGGIRMSYTQLKTMEQKIVDVSYTFAELFTHMTSGYLQKNFNVSSIEELEKDWRALVYRSISKVTITKMSNSIVPSLESRVDRNIIDRNITVSGKDTGNKKIDHPKFRNKKRVTRGLIDLGGSLLHSLFGVAQDSDIENLKEKEDAKLNRIINATRTIEIVAEKNEEKVSQALTHIKGAIERLQPIAERENRLETFLQLESILEHLSNVAHYLLSLGREVETRVTLLQEGLVPPIINSEDLKQLLNEGLRKFPNLKFPYEIENLKNSNLGMYLKLIHAESTSRPYMFILSIPYIAKSDTFKLFSLDKFPVKTRSDNVTNNVMIVEELPNYIAKNNYTYVLMEDTNNCIPLVGENKVLCSLNNPKVSLEVETCALAMVKNSTMMAKKQCEYVKSNFTTGYFAINKENSWYIFFIKPVIGTINCPDSSIYKNRPLKNFVGSIIISPPCSLTSTTFSLPTVNTAMGTRHYDPIRTLPHEHLYIDNETDIEPNGNLRALSGDIETLKNLSDTRHNILSTQLNAISDTTFIHQTTFSFITGLILIIVIAVICTLRYRKSLLCSCPCLPVFSKSKHSRRDNDELASVMHEMNDLKGQLRDLTRQQEMVSPLSEISHLPNEGLNDETVHMEIPNSDYDDIENLFRKVNREPCLLKTPPRKPKRFHPTPLSIPSVAEVVTLDESCGTIRKKGRSQPVERLLHRADRERSPAEDETGYLRIQVQKAIRNNDKAHKLETITEL